MHRVSTVRKGLTGFLFGLIVAAPLASAAAQTPQNNCWLGSLVFPPDKEFSALKTYQKVYANRLKANPGDEKMAARLRVTEDNIAKFLSGRTPAQKLFATGGVVPIALTSKSAFLVGEPLAMTVRTCGAHPIAGYCSEEAAHALDGESIETTITGIGALAKDSVYGYLRLYVEPEFDGMKGRGFARVEFAGQQHWDQAQGRAIEGACPE